MFTRQLSLAAIAMLAIACTEPPLAPTGGGGGGGGEQDIVVSPLAPAPGSPVIFDSGNLGAGTRSWAFGDGTSDTGVVVVHTFANAGTYGVQLVLDDGAESRQHSIMVVVEEGNREPERAETLRARP